MAKNIFIVGTGTDIGKTYISAMVVKKLRQSQINCGYYKPVLSGAEKSEGRLLAGDANYVYNMANISGDPNDSVSYIFEPAVSPHFAADLSKAEISMQKIKNDFKLMQKKYTHIVVEGSGGVICPISAGKEKIMLIDIIKELKLDTILVADAGLGTINSTMLSLEYLKMKGIKVKLIVLNRYDDKNIIHIENKRYLSCTSEVDITTCRLESGEIDMTKNELEAVF